MSFCSCIGWEPSRANQNVDYDDIPYYFGSYIYDVHKIKAVLTPTLSTLSLTHPQLCMSTKCMTWSSKPVLGKLLLKSN